MEPWEGQTGDESDWEKMCEVLFSMSGRKKFAVNRKEVAPGKRGRDGRIRRCRLL